MRACRGRLSNRVESRSNASTPFGPAAVAFFNTALSASRPFAIASGHRSHRRRRRSRGLEAHHALDAVAVEHQPNELQGGAFGVSVVDREAEGEVDLVALGRPHPADGEVLE